MLEAQNGEPTPDALQASAPTDPTLDRSRLLAQIGALTIHHGAALEHIATQDARITKLNAQVTELQAANAQLREQIGGYAAIAREREAAR